MNTPRPVVLCILDGWGLRDDPVGNAPKLANTPNFDRIMANCPHATLITYGPDVGLPTGQMGNSEVGHTNMGAGRVVAMDLGQIDLAIEDGSFAKNKALLDFIEKLKSTGGTAHIAGLASPGGVHSHLSHIVEAARVIAAAGVPLVIHAITDGRDVPPKSAADQIDELVAALPKNAKIATLVGRYYAMDRDNRWDRVESAYRAIVKGEGERRTGLKPSQIIREYYKSGLTDEFLPATVIDDYDGIHDGDGLMFINFRADRAREILSAIGDPDFANFDTGKRPALAAMLGMVEYSDKINRFMTAMFPKKEIVNTLPSWISSHGLSQFHIAETEKYPHVTFFFNGGKEEPEPGEDRYMAPSPKVATYDLQPEMSAAEVTEHLVDAIRKPYDFIVANYANPDMVGHTGDLDAAIKACEAVDEGLGQILKAVKEMGGALVVTADHGNCETMIDPETGGPHTAHTTNPVPVILVGGPPNAKLSNGRLADIAPTILELMGLEKPPEMTGKSLIRK